MAQQTSLMEMAADLRMWDKKTTDAIDKVRRRNVENFALVQLQEYTTQNAMDTLRVAIRAMITLYTEASRLANTTAPAPGQEGGE